MYNVYALSVDGSTFRYVGATKYADVARRATLWYAQRFQHKTPVAKWIQEEAANGRRVMATLLEANCRDGDRAKEQWWIVRLRDEGHDLLNVMGGGSRNYRSNFSWNRGKRTGPPSEATRRKISQSLLGNIPHNKGKPMSEEQRQKLRGRPVSEETRAKMRASRLAYLERQGKGESPARDDSR